MSNVYALRKPVLFTNASFGTSVLREPPSEQRKQSIDFHVKSNDYFGTLATVLGLVADTLQHNADSSQKKLIDLKDELVYLQETFEIRRK